MPRSLVSFFRGQPAQPFRKKRQQRWQILQRLAHRFQFEPITGAYRFESGCIKSAEIGSEDACFVSGLMVNENESRLRPIFLESKRNPLVLATEKDGAETLTREGWNLRQSQMTQEIQLVPGQGQPRLLPGCTISGGLLLLGISERTCHLVGASFPEAMMEVFHPSVHEGFIECEIQVMRSSPSRKPTIDLCLIPFRSRGCIWSMERRIRGYASVTEESGTSSLSMVDRDPSRYAT